MDRKLFKAATVLAASMLMGGIASGQGNDSVLYTIDDAIPAFVQLPESVTTAKRSAKKGVRQKSELLKQALRLNDDTKAVLCDTFTDAEGGEHESYHQTYRGVKVDGTRYGIHFKDGKAAFIKCNFRTISGLCITPVLTEQQALEKALEYVGAERYMWQNPAN